VLTSANSSREMNGRAIKVASDDIPGRFDVGDFSLITRSNC